MGDNPPEQPDEDASLSEKWEWMEEYDLWNWDVSQSDQEDR